MIKTKTKYISIQLLLKWTIPNWSLFYIGWWWGKYNWREKLIWGLFLRRESSENVSKQINFHAKCGKENKSFSALCRKSHVFIWPYFISTFSAHPLSNSRNVQRTYKKQPAGFVNLFDSAQHTTRIWRSIINYSQKSE